jgi:cell division protein FtsN|tara:strand:- start:17944 stop:18480 length:537 start_codon:yes stop_codon:yes gene_type:complete
MSQNYAKRNSGRGKQQPAKRASGLPAFILGTVFGAILTSLLPGLMDKAPTATAKVQDVTETVKAEASELQFDFYTLLKKTEIIVPNNASEEGEDQQPEENFTYLLQAGSFKIANDAESRRVKLLLLNLNASVELINLGNGEKWHRVLVGPFDDASSMAYARTKLSENQIDSLLLKRKI